MRRVIELDSLRGLAAVIVLLFHLHPGRFFFGWAGVDLFFVLSGYLITSVILEYGGTKGFLWRFYARRTIRIWPIYYLTVLGFVAINPFLPRVQPLDELPNLLTFTKNVSLWRHNSVPPQIAPLDHTWTLSLEEQFYLVWPALILLVGPRRLIPLCIGLAALSVVARDGQTLLIWNRYSERILVGRCDGFAMGGLLAALLIEARRRPHRLRYLRMGLGIAATSGLAYLVHGYFYRGGVSFIGLPTPRFPGTTTFAFVLLFFGVVGMVVLSAGHPSLAPLRLRPLTYLGQISYALYLYHLPIYSLFDISPYQPQPPLAGDILKLVTVLVAAALSWMLIERPILGLKGHLEYKSGPIAPDRDRVRDDQRPAGLA
jgi:peptidoglycan/LPS O-acetylase OafA/YrhL